MLLVGTRMGSRSAGSKPATCTRRHTSRPDGQTDDVYDLVVLGGGLSGLSAAHLYREKVGPDARILILDNHDDFGGHAKRNEFDVDGKQLICYGGSQSIDTPGHYSPVASQLLKDVGIDTQCFYDISIAAITRIAIFATASISAKKSMVTTG